MNVHIVSAMRVTAVVNTGEFVCIYGNNPERRYCLITKAHGFELTTGDYVTFAGVVVHLGDPTTVLCENINKITREEKQMGYVPNPVDTSDVSLPPMTVELANLIAKNVHDVWAKGRMEQGWTYGPNRDDERKQHPCLIPYVLLSDEEKEYDLNTAFETLKLIIKCGYKITKEGE